LPSDLFTEELDQEKKTLSLMKDMLKFNQLVAMKMSKNAWDGVFSTSTIENCWGANKIIKKSPSNFLEVM
jgi:hypothetical protein